MVELGEERLALDAVYHAGFLYGLTPGRGAAQAMHTDGEEQRRALGRDIQNISDNGVLFNFHSHDRCPPKFHLCPYYNRTLGKKQGGREDFVGLSRNLA